MEITVKDFRHALQEIEVVGNCMPLDDHPHQYEAPLLKNGLKKNGSTRDIKMERLITELSHMCHVELPTEIYKVASNQSELEMVNTINQYIHELENYNI